MANAHSSSFIIETKNYTGTTRVKFHAVIDDLSYVKKIKKNLYEGSGGHFTPWRDYCTTCRLLRGFVVYHFSVSSKPTCHL